MDHQQFFTADDSAPKPKTKNQYSKDSNAKKLFPPQDLDKNNLPTNKQVVQAVKFHNLDFHFVAKKIEKLCLDEPEFNTSYDSLNDVTIKVASIRALSARVKGLYDMYVKFLKEYGHNPLTWDNFEIEMSELFDASYKKLEGGAMKKVAEVLARSVGDLLMEHWCLNAWHKWSPGWCSQVTASPTSTFQHK